MADTTQHSQQHIYIDCKLSGRKNQAGRAGESDKQGVQNAKKHTHTDTPTDPPPKLGMFWARIEKNVNYGLNYKNTKIGAMFGL